MLSNQQEKSNMLILLNCSRKFHPGKEFLLKESKTQVLDSRFSSKTKKICLSRRMAICMLNIYLLKNLVKLHFFSEICGFSEIISDFLKFSQDF